MGRYDAALLSSGFAIGATHYEDHYPGDSHNPRIVVSVATERNGAIEQTVQMIVDTGATWCVLDPEVAESWGLAPTQEDPLRNFQIRGYDYEGHLVRARIVLLATNGQSLAIEVTIFVPKLTSDGAWRHPNFLGYDTCLSHIRFAVDARENIFYFGSDATA